MFEKVDQKVSFPDLEKQMMARWKQENTFQKSLDLRAGKPRFVFYEGPPTANGKPATHHILARAFKDLFPRYKTMKGFYVERKAGWDTHGLPVEIEVEKKLKISGKFEIENEIGIERFNELCRESVTEYVTDWVAFSERMGFCLDYDNAYWTLTPDYIQSVWWALSEMWKQGLVYKGFRVAPYCPRCATPLSSHELAQGYQDNVPDPSVYVRFRLKKDQPGARRAHDQPGARRAHDFDKTSILAWTTTPWTLPGNVALAVDNDVDYIKVKDGDGFLILAEARLSVLNESPEVVERMKGRDLVGLDYEPLYPYSIPAEGRAHYVVNADFVSTEEGTGVVHTSALYGVDDLRLCQEKGIPFKHTVGLDGKFLPYVEKFAGLHVKEADPVILDDLKARGLLYKSETTLHTYPFCWRCGTPLIYYALDSWYVRTTQRKGELIANNQATNWVPAHIKTGRMGDWLENNVDWAISRSRYWGTPLPFWVCDNCEQQKCISSSAELGLKADTDLHRPFIDTVTLPCDKCDGVMRRVPEVLDAWFDSGSMPFAQRGHPLQGTKEFEETFPADFISEAMDQTRGWFYSLLAISTLLFKQNAYRNVICLGLVVDPKGKKQSKSRGNVLDPNYLFDNFGSDAVRWYFYTSSPVGENYRTSAETLRETVQQFFIPLWNCYSFFVTYARLDGFDASQAAVPVAERHVLDRWLLSRLSGLIDTVTGGLDGYDANEPARRIQRFVDDLSNWYIRRSRRRFWKSQSDSDKLAAEQTLYEALRTVSQLMAPFVPFTSDAIYRNLSNDESVHLSDFPAPTSNHDARVEADMARARQAVEAGLSARDAARLKVRQPLASIALPGEPLPEDVAQIVREELNVKELTFNAPEVTLDTEITEELKLEGLAREVVRAIQDRRKKLGFNVEDRIQTRYEADGMLERAIDRHAGYIKNETLSVAVDKGRADDFDGEQMMIEGEQIWIGLKRN
ncbi:MAG TPA: isoleucine--tRNA ligase [Candidatus Dormibacteraeota bacterium]|nr:isoleucine--tRNA ligase [Candidatus Dormibacteraeota bacterium]